MKDNLLQKLEDNHVSSMQEIKKYLSSNRKDIVSIITYLLNTDPNPHYFLPKQIAETINSSQGFLNFIQLLEKSIYYSKDICFPVINGSPKIAFVEKDKFNVEKYLNEDQNIIQEYQVYFLPNIQEFIYEHSIYQFQLEKELFFHQARMSGLEEAIKEFKSNRTFDNSWIQEYNQEN